MVSLVITAGCQTESPLEKKVADLESRVSKLEGFNNAIMLQTAATSKVENINKPVVKQKTPQELAAINKERIKARARMAEDSKIYSENELREIESLYKNMSSQYKSEAEAKESFKKLVENFDRANRTGCAFLYMAARGEEAEQINTLEQVIEKYGDCFYGNGVQVGAYARFRLAEIYFLKGEKEKARKLFDEIVTTYPDAIDHSGQSLKIRIKELGEVSK